MRTTFLMALCVTLVASLATIPSAAAQTDPRTPPHPARRTPVVDVFEANRDAVVNISSTEIVTMRDPMGLDRMFEDFFDMPNRNPLGRERQYTRTSVGSGFVIHPDGYIVTNAHVVAQTAERKVSFSDGREFDAQVVAADAKRDLAVLKIEADKPLQPIKLGRSDDLMIGETVIAIGNPLGFQNTVTAGVVSAVKRDLDFANRVTLSGLIQTDASINPGNSGGPLLNVLGELIGVNTAIRGDAQNIGFAIPVDHLREVLPDLLDVERRYRIIVGATVSSVDSPRVTAVKPQSPAADAGLQQGDVVCEVDHRPVAEGIDFYIALIGRVPGETIPLTVTRGGRTVEASLTLGGRPAPDGAKLAGEKLGVEVTPVPANLARQLGVREGAGLLVESVEPGGPAEQLGLARWDVLLAIGKHSVTSLDDLGQLLEFVDPGEHVPITILRAERRGKFKLSGELEAR
jgi:serine protease Do